MPEALHRRLHVAAGDRDVSVNLLVTKAVNEYLDRLPSADKVLSSKRSRSKRGSTS